MIIINNEQSPLNKIIAKRKKNSYYYTILLKILFNKKIYIYSFFLLSYLLYYFSLEKCTEGMDECPKKIDWMQTKIKEVIFSCLIMAILIELIIYKKINKLHLIHIIFSFALFYSYSHGLDFEDHGYFNFKGYLFLFIIFTILFFPINVLIYLIQKKKNKIIILIYIVFLISILILINILFNTYKTDCINCPKG